MKLDSPLRVYVDPGAQTVRVAADMRFSSERRGCFHLHCVEGRLYWVKHREGDYVLPITLDDFTAFLQRGGLRDVSPVLAIGDNVADDEEEVTHDG